VLICSPQHPFASRGRLHYADTLAENYVSLSADSAIHGFLLDRAREAGRRPRIRAQVRAFDAVCRMVSAGVGVAVVPHSAAVASSAAVPLAVVELNDAWGSREMKLCFRREQTLSPYQRELITHLTLISQAGRSGV